MVIRFLIDKYVKKGRKKLYACFFDLRKAFDTVNRTRMFYNLLSQYNIGGQFLKTIMSMYDGNEMYVRIHGGLTVPFITTVGVKQGCVLSPLLFNLFLNKLLDQYDETCDPVEINGKPLHVLMYADDCVVFSLSANGLKKAIGKTVEHFSSLNLEVNTLKTKVLIFNLSGQSLASDPNHKFIVNSKPLAVVSEYTYLGIKLKSSGTFTTAIEELCSKAGRAWNSLSTLLFTNKRMHIDRALRLFDSLITSIALYACELWLPFVFTKKSWESPENILNFWEKFKCETLNQKLCRLLLSVHKDFKTMFPW